MHHLGCLVVKRGVKRSSARNDKENCAKRPKSNQVPNSQGLVGSGRGVAQGINYKEASKITDDPNDKVMVIGVQKCSSEREAYDQTGLTGGKERR